MKQRPAFIKHFSEALDPVPGRYEGTEELMTAGSRLGRAVGLKKVGINIELLPPGRRTSLPHAERDEEEFVYVLEGSPDAWINGELYRLQPGDGVGFPSGTGIAHCFINNTQTEVKLLVAGEASRRGSGCYYPLNPERRGYWPASLWWDNAPPQILGPHDGLPDAQRKR